MALQPTLPHAPARGVPARHRTGQPATCATECSDTPGSESAPAEVLHKNTCLASLIDDSLRTSLTSTSALLRHVPLSSTAQLRSIRLPCAMAGRCVSPALMHFMRHTVQRHEGCCCETRKRKKKREESPHGTEGGYPAASGGYTALVAVMAHHCACLPVSLLHNRCSVSMHLPVLRGAHARHAFRRGARQCAVVARSGPRAQARCVCKSLGVSGAPLH
jgi:hypothetical protein